MKKIPLIFMLLIIVISTFSQQNNPAPALTKQDYLKKARSQKTTAWILLGGGFVIASAGLLVEAVEVTTYVLTLPYPEPEEPSNTGSVLLISGSLVMLSSIPFFSAASKNKKKALSISFKNEKALQVQNYSYVSVLVPSVSLKIAL
ncbi:MAG TPA: hypothetical protein VIZ28_06665 [Chitinophagaceae bacterium]